MIKNDQQNQQNVYGQPGVAGYANYTNQPGVADYPNYANQPGVAGYPNYANQGIHPPYTATSDIARDPTMASATQNDAFIYVGVGSADETFAFSEKSIRRAFIRKVYAILMVQLSISVGFIAWFSYHEPTRKYIQRNILLLYISLIVMVVCTIVMACCGNVRRKAPMNYIFLFIFTLAVSFMLGAVSSTFEVEAVILAVGISAAVCLALTVFAFQTKWDFTMMGGALYVALIILILFGLIAIFIHDRILQLVYASLGALLFSFYLVYDTQLMIGGNHKYSISPEEYIFAALSLYLDVVNIFLFILAIVGGSRR